jgi:hypothetical protein
MRNELSNLILLAKAYRVFLLELGEAFNEVKETKAYEGYSDTFIDAVKSPEIGFSVSEAELLIKMYNMFCMLEQSDLPSHHSMKLMVSKKVNMDLLESAKTLSVTDFKELMKDEETGTQERTYRYEVIKRIVETNNIKKVYGEELEDAIKQLTKDAQ